jgi:hypothetical protein
MQTPPREFGFANLQRVNNGPTRCLPLFFVPPRRPHPRISAAKAMSIAAVFLQKQRGSAELAAELLQLPQVRPGRCPLSPRAGWPHLRGLQPEEEAPLQICCRSSGLSYTGQPQAVGIRPACQSAGGEGRAGVSPAAPPPRNDARPNR